VEKTQGRRLKAENKRASHEHENDCQTSHSTRGLEITVARLAVEQASTFGWERYVGAEGRIIGMKTFGASAPLKELQKKFGFVPEQLVAVAKNLLSKNLNTHE
jgi:transketolase